MKPKRKVSKNLGHTQYGQAELLYSIIRNKYGSFRSCPFYGGDKYSQFDLNTHDALNPQFKNPNVPIEQFDFQVKGDTWKLQSYCKTCYKAYRDARIKKARTGWVNSDGTLMTDNQIREWYVKNVGPTMQCSVCKKDLEPRIFSISRSMEKGLHNECNDCQMSKANSVREQEWLADGNWTSWKNEVIKLRKLKEVACTGWSRSVNSGDCLILDVGRNMHADHIIPLRAGGIHDASNFQPLCCVCNSKKSDQIDPAIERNQIKDLVGKYYKNIISDEDSISTIESKLKIAVVNRIEKLISEEKYIDAIKYKKKEVNGQWDINHAYKKGKEWILRTTNIR